MFVYNFDWVYLVIIVVFICVCLSLMLCCFNRVLAIFCGLLCLTSLGGLLLFFDFSLFIILFFLIYSSFFLVIFLCVLAYIADDMYFSINWVVFFVCFVFLFLFVDCFVYWGGGSFYLYFYDYDSYRLYDFVYYFIVNDFSDTGLLGDLLFTQFPFFVMLIGFFLFLGLISVPLLIYSIIKIQGGMLKNSNKYMLKRILKL